jgi:F-type H+-transporting ATPase subunit delta
MSETLTLARPYARAAFESARDANALAAWSQKLAFSAQVLADARIKAIIGDPRLGNSDLVTLLSPPDEPADSGFSGFLGLLVDNRRAGLLVDIAALFEELKRESERVLKVMLRSANAMPDGEAEKIKVALKKRFGRDIELEQRVDPALIGGAVIDAGDVVIDGSVSGRLARLENALAG